LWVGGELIGGCDIVTEMHEKGELQTVIDAAVPNEA
jgi:monothiol glutaredoxin